MGMGSDRALARWHGGFVWDDAKEFICKARLKGRYVVVQRVHLGAQSDNVFAAQWTDDHFPQANVAAELFEEKLAIDASRQFHNFTLSLRQFDFDALFSLICPTGVLCSEKLIDETRYHSQRKGCAL